MIAIKGIFDGKDIKLLEPIPFTNRRAVIITFLDEREFPEIRRDWRKLRGSAKGKNLTKALLKARQEDIARE